jgi:K+-transporting ATPase A subunit
MAAAEWFYCNEKREPQINWATFIIILKSCTRILLPLSALVAIALLFSGHQ